MTKTLIIAELGSSWRFGNDHLATAEKMIREAKACGADVAKFQWTSNGPAMAKRRGLDDAAGSMYAKYLMFPQDWLPKLKAMCDEAGIEFMVTCYLVQDIPVVAPLVKRFKISAFEADWDEFCLAHKKYVPDDAGSDRWPIVSVNPGSKHSWYVEGWLSYGEDRRYVGHPHFLHCISKYPTPLEELGLDACRAGEDEGMGLSDHTTSTLTGALAVAAGATILEKHVRLWDTPQDNPDYGHSLILDSDGEEVSFAEYVRNVREAERCM